MQNIVQAANQYMNIVLKVVGSQITLNKFEQEKFGPYSYVLINMLCERIEFHTENFFFFHSCRKDNFLTSMSEFIVHKITERHPEPTKRILCLTEATILERDPQTYSVCYSYLISQSIALTLTERFIF